MTAEYILETLRSMSNPENVKGMARFGISSTNTLGISMPALRDLAKKAGRNHLRALELWDSAVHEARIFAALTDNPSEVTEEQMEKWVLDFDSWDVCDQCCMNLFDRTPFAYKKAAEWSSRQEEFVKRAAFALMASLAMHDKKAEDSRFLSLLPLMEQEAYDERNFVKKAVNWALRQTGKRTMVLNACAKETAEKIMAQNTKAARWIAADALKELNDPKILKRIKK
jgi:3-methyladenine DNA glycosylase AlkD